MKRAHRQLNGGDAEASRAKRRKEMAVAGSSSDVDITSSDPVAEYSVPKARGGDVREQGMKLWHTVKDAVNKECVLRVYTVTDRLLHSGQRSHSLH
jgi:hypothetical protein